MSDNFSNMSIEQLNKLAAQHIQALNDILDELEDNSLIGDEVIPCAEALDLLSEHMTNIKA